MKIRPLLADKTRFLPGCLATVFLPLLLGIHSDRALSQTPTYPHPIPPRRGDISPPRLRCFPDLVFTPSPILRRPILLMGYDNLFGDLAIEYSRLGREQQAIALLENLTNRDNSKAVIFFQLAEVYREQRNFADAIDFLDRSLAIARSREDTHLLAFIALEFVEVRRVEKGIEIARSLDETLQAHILKKIALKIVPTGQIKRARQIALMLTENRDRIEIWSEIFQTYFEEDPDKVTAFLQTIPDECDRDRAIHNAIERGLDGGENAHELLNLIETPRMQDFARVKVATNLAENGRFEQALAIADPLASSASRARVLIAIAASLRQRGQEDRAAQILDRARKITENLRRSGNWGISN